MLFYSFIYILLIGFFSVTLVYFFAISAYRRQYSNIAVALIIILAYIFTVYAFPGVIDILYLALLAVQFIFTGYIMWFTYTSLRYLWRYRYNKRPESFTFEPPPTIAIIVSVRNEQSLIPDLVNSLSRLKYSEGKLTIYLVDDGSEDESLKVMREFVNDHIKVCSFPRRGLFPVNGKAMVINSMVKTLTEDLICVFDSDSRPAPDFFEKTIPYFRNESVGIVQGRNIQINEKSNIVSILTSLDLYATQFCTYFSLANHGFSVFEGRAGIVRRDVFTSIGLFDETLPGEDLDLAYRFSIRGHTGVFVTDAVNYEFVTATFKEWHRQRFRWLGNHVKAGVKNFVELARSQINAKSKVAGFFYITNIFWFLSLNLVPVLKITELGGLGTDLNWTLFWGSFIFVSVLYILPALVWTSRIYFLLVSPLMLVYYWTFSFFITWIYVNEYLLGKPIRYKKARYSTI
jgi:cellulose synthase/poly-beta-1,6-N-acetylglucosamine synthase-like glycosyltransferase